MKVDNATIVSRFVPSIDDGDHFVYTEILDRTKRPGNNGARLLRTFYHRSIADFERHLPAIRAMCDATGARAYMRPAARSWRAVGKLFARLVVDAALTDNWCGMKTLYSSACGKVVPIENLWLFDVDEESQESIALAARLLSADLLVAEVPSKRGIHLIVKAHRIRETLPAGVENKKDCPTNLYIPDGAT